MAGFLEGSLAPVVYGALGWLLLDATLYQRRMVDNGKGGFTAAPPDEVPCKAMVDAASETMRAAPDFNEKDVGLLILAASLPEPKLDDELAVRGERYQLLAPITLDAAMTHYTARGRRM